jgi:transcriptional regulator with XRE-family HTH domain
MSEPKGRFAQALIAGLNEKGMTKNDLAAKLEISYEYVRKMEQGRGWPSRLLLKEICKLLGLKEEAMQDLIAEDQLEKKYGKSGMKAIGKDPRAGQLESAGLRLLNKDQFNMVVNMVEGLSKGNRKSGTGD